MSAYAAPVDAEKLARRLAIDYVGSRLDATGGSAVKAQMQTYLVGAKPHIPSSMVDLGARLYQPPPVTLKAPLASPQHRPGRGLRHLLGMKRQPALGGSLPQALPKAALGHQAFGAAAPTQVFRQAMASPALTWPRYEPMGKWGIVWIKASTSAPVELGAGAVLRSVAANLVRYKALGEVEEIDRYVDEGLNRPPARQVQTLRVRLVPAGRATPRIAYDPDRE